MEFYQSDFVQNDKQFTTEEERHGYTAQVIYTRYVSRPPVKPHNIIPFGFDAVRKAKSSGNLQSALYIAELTKNGISKKRIVLRGHSATLYRGISLWSGYKDVKLGSFGNSQDLIADNRAIFQNPIPTKIKPHELIEKLGIKRVTISQAPDYPTIVDNKGYMDRLDLRIMRGIIVAPPTIFERKDGSKIKGANYKISDLTVNPSATQLSDRGAIIRPSMTVWIAPELVMYEQDSECDFIGTIGTNKKTGEATMNAISILPVHARELSVSATPEEVSGDEIPDEETS